MLQQSNEHLSKFIIKIVLNVTFSPFDLPRMGYIILTLFTSHPHPVIDKLWIMVSDFQLFSGILIC